MNGVDAIIFTAGIGENSATIRSLILEGLEFMDIKLDEELNYNSWTRSFIHAPDSSVKLMVIPTE